jgi:hypothetical protein
MNFILRFMTRSIIMGGVILGDRKNSTLALLNLIFIFASFNACQLSEKSKGLSYKGPAEVRYTEVGQGAFVLQLDNGELFEPEELPQDFRVHGLKVQVELRNSKKAFPKGCQCAPHVELVEIRKSDKLPLCTDEMQAGLTVQLVDAHGDPVQGAMLEVRAPNFSERLEESGDGNYQGLFEHSGQFNLMISKNGFKKTQMPVAIVAGVCHVQTKSLNVTLETE